jgi:hypothetical protein
MKRFFPTVQPEEGNPAMSYRIVLAGTIVVMVIIVGITAALFFL